MSLERVGLEFVSVGKEKAQRDITEYSRSTEILEQRLGAAVASANAFAKGIFDNVKAYQDGTRYLREYDKVLRENARANQEAIRSLTESERANKSAADSAAVFVEALRRQETETSRVAASTQAYLQQVMQIDQPYRSAAESAAAFSRALQAQEVETARLAAASQTYLQQLLQIDQPYRSASESAEFFVQALRQQEAETARLAAATQTYLRDLLQIDQPYRSASESADFFVQALRKQEAEKAKTAAATQAYLQQLMRIDQPYRSASESSDVFTQAQNRSTESYNRLRASIDPVFAANQRLRQAQQTLRQAVDQGAVSARTAAETLRLYRQRMREAGQSTVTTTNLTGRLRTQFLATANTIAILDGPLGGIASRFSAFGVLLGRTGFLLAGVAVSATALFTIVGRGIRNFTEFEAQTARMNAVLDATNNQVGLTAENIERMASSIALATLESEQGVRAAAGRLLTFRNIAGDIFEDVLKSASDLSALGFGTIESEAVKLAKALDDPRQSLTSLSRAGITFTRQQRAVIISMVESGRQADAMAAILENVDRQVGGAGAAAARDTMAGQFDTIGQAVSQATRELGEFVATEFGVQAVIRALAEASASYIESSDPKVILQGLKDQRAELQALEVIEGNRGTAFLKRGQIMERHYARELKRLNDLISAQEAEIRNAETSARLAAVRAQETRAREGLDDLRESIELRTRLVGLTEEQTRVERELAQAGLAGVDPSARASALFDAMVNAGRSISEAQSAAASLFEELSKAVAEGDRLAEVMSMERLGRSVVGNLQTMTQQNEVLAQQVAYMRQGVEQGDARRRAEEDIAIAAADTLDQFRRANGHASDFGARVRAAVEQGRQIAEETRVISFEMSLAAQEAERFNSALNGAASATSALQSRVIGLKAETEALANGADRYAANMARALAVQRAANRAEVSTIADPVARAAAQALLNVELSKQNALMEEEADLLRRREALTSSGGKGGSSAAAKELQTLESIVAEMDKRISREQQILRARDDERAQLEAYFALKDALESAEIQYNDSELQRIAARIAAREQETERLKRQEVAAQRLEGAFQSFFTSTVTGSGKFRQALSQLLNQLAQMAANAAFQQLFGGMFGGGGGRGGFLSGLTSFFFNANGNAFSGGRVIPFANGGVVDRPTMFPMAGPNTGLMGEAGPEAIMPLKRGSNGQLGVQGGQQQVDIRLHVTEGVTAELVGQIATGVSVKVMQAGMKRSRAALPGQLTESQNRGR
jgi:uncharacterized protein YoxC